MSIRCGICGFPMPAVAKDDPTAHPGHTDAELAETKAAVEAAARALTVLYFLDQAHKAVMA